MEEKKIAEEDHAVAIAEAEKEILAEKKDLNKLFDSECNNYKFFLKN